MDVVVTPEEMQAWSAARRRREERVGLAPTMGFLHEGHLELVRYARENCDALVVSIFVNPRQFGPKEDLAQYPRDLERDLGLLRPLGVDAVFHPAPADMYPEGFQTVVEVTGLTRGLCGAFRPHFFPGVTTVVLKLFNCVRPDLAVFGRKDYQQLKAVQRMAADLHLPIEVVGRPTVREADGLAMSSRNTYLSPEDRRDALALYESIRLAEEMVRGGERRPAAVLAAVRSHLKQRPRVEIQYAELVDPETLVPVADLAAGAVLALAAFVDGVRLIDNEDLTPLVKDQNQT